MGRSWETYSKLVDVGVALVNGKYTYSKGFSTPVSFSSNSVVDIAFDQSTTHIGVAMKLHGGPVVCIVDFINKGLPDKGIFYDFFTEYLKGFLKGLTVKYVVYEDPVEHSRTVMTRNILMELRGYIKTLYLHVPELEDAKFVEINIGTWRKHFLKDPVYQGRRKKTELVKEATEEEVLKRYPMFETFVGLFSNPPDSMDAVGILEGWTEEYFVSSEMTGIRVNKCMRPVYNISYQSSLERVPLEGIKDRLRQKFGAMVVARGYQYLWYNGEFTLDDNALRACSNFNEYCAIIISQRKDIQTVRWKIQEDLAQGEVYVLFCHRSNITNQLPCNPLSEEELEYWKHSR